MTEKHVPNIEKYLDIRLEASTGATKKILSVIKKIDDSYQIKLATAIGAAANVYIAFVISLCEQREIEVDTQKINDAVINLTNSILTTGLQDK